MAKKKSQIEISGLIVIVLLLLMGFFLVIALGKQSSTDKTGYAHDLAVNFVTVLPQVKLDCNGQEVRMNEYIRACALGIATFCGGNPCEAITLSAQTSLDNTLKLWGYDYILTIEPNAQTGIVIKSPADIPGPPIKIVACTKKTRKIFASQQIPLGTSGGNAAVTLRICY